MLRLRLNADIKKGCAGVSKGRLIVIEGTDGSGKATQTALLCERLAKNSRASTKLSFPRYGKPSAKLVEMYLAGAFGEDPNAVSAYEASKFYAIDRYASYIEDWGLAYEKGGLIVSDRYTTSNAVHQSSKMAKEDREAFYKWLYEMEHEKMGVPAPDLVIYLDMPLDVTEKLMRAREDKTSTKADIHEKNTSYLAMCKEAALDAAEYYGWHVIKCSENGEPRSIESINDEIYSLVCKFL